MTIAKKSNRVSSFSLSLSAIYTINFQPNDKWLQIETWIQYRCIDIRDGNPRVQGRAAIKKWRRIETMCMLAYESRSAYCLRHGGTCYISHSRWHDDVTRRCAESSSCSFINNDPRRARLSRPSPRCAVNGAFGNFTKFLRLLPWLNFPQDSFAYRRIADFA